MKKWNLLLSMFLMAAALFVTSCTDDEETDPGPSLTLKGGSEYTSTDATIQVEEPILVGVTGASSTVSNDKLTRFKFSIVSNDVPEVFVDSVFSEATFNWETEITFTSVGEANLLFELWDKGGKKVQKSFRITVENSAMEINKDLNFDLGSWNDAVGSFYSTTDGEVYTRGLMLNNPTNQAKIDFLFFKGVVNANTIAAPDDTDANTINELQLEPWTIKNSTRFNTTTITAAEFDAIGTTYQFPAFDMNTQTSKVNAVADGQVILFKTEGGKLGLIKIVDLFSRGDLATISVIVQK